MSDDGTNEQDPAKAGYKSPPLATRFKPGQSGNPKGRPKARRSFEEDIFEELEELIDIGDDQELIVTKQRAIIKSLVHSAIRGNVRAMMMISAMCGQNSEEQEIDSSDEDHDRRIFEELVEREVQKRLNQLNQENS